LQNDGTLLEAVEHRVSTTIERIPSLQQQGNHIRSELLYVPGRGEVVLLHDERNLRGFWKLARIEELLKGPDGHVRGAVIRVPSRSSSTILRRPLSRLYPLEIECRPTEELNQPANTSQNNEVEEEPQQVQGAEPRDRPKRAAAQRASEWMKALIKQF